MSLAEICTLFAAIAAIVAVYFAGVHLGSNFITERKLRKFKMTLAKENKEKMDEILSEIVIKIAQQNKEPKSEESQIDLIRQIVMRDDLGIPKVGFSADQRGEQNEN